MNSQRHTFKRTDNYHIELEYFGENNAEVAIHVNIVKWSSKVYKELIAIWIDMEDLLIETGYTRIFGMLPARNKNFAYMFGWELGDQVGNHVIAFKELV